jgi:hypothetical protein
MTVTASGRKPQYRGDLAETALPEMFAMIHRALVPGVVEATRDGVQKRVFLRDGYVLFATSDDRADSLGEFVLRTGLISPAGALELAKLREASPRRLGELLVERRLLSPAHVREAIRQQISAIVWSLFGWDRGEVTFRIGDFEEPNLVRIDLPLRQVILRGIHHVADAKRLVARLGRKDTQYEPCWRAEDLIELALDGEEFKLLSLVNGKRSLYELCTQGPASPAENGKTLYAFRVLQLIRERGDEAGSGGVRIKFKTEREGA